MSDFDPIPLIERLGARVVKAVASAAGTDDRSKWVPGHLTYAAMWLESGDRRAGIRRPYPRLAKGLRRVAATWYVKRMNLEPLR